ncbi:hypothetical protein [Nocardia sp. NPDC058666]|uniref:hypothetical protein n=1 Tax=unclassified Nocardia TaxID=2637762 RepID=UPI003664E891
MAVHARLAMDSEELERNWPVPEIEVLDSEDFTTSPLTSDRVSRLSPTARHRIAAFVHTTLADLEEMPEPRLPAPVRPLSLIVCNTDE